MKYFNKKSVFLSFLLFSVATNQIQAMEISIEVVSKVAIQKLFFKLIQKAIHKNKELKKKISETTVSIKKLISKNKPIQAIMRANDIIKKLRGVTLIYEKYLTKELTKNLSTSLINLEANNIVDFIIDSALSKVIDETELSISKESNDKDLTKLISSHAKNLVDQYVNIIAQDDTTQSDLQNLTKEKNIQQISHALENNKLFATSYLMAKEEAIDQLINTLKIDDEGLKAKLEINTIFLPGILGDSYDIVVKKLNTIFFDKSGQFISNPNNGKATELIASFLKSVSVDEVEYLQYLKRFSDLGKSEILLQVEKLKKNIKLTKDNSLVRFIKKVIPEKFSDIETLDQAIINNLDDNKILPHLLKFRKIFNKQKELNGSNLVQVDGLEEKEFDLKYLIDDFKKVEITQDPGPDCRVGQGRPGVNNWLHKKEKEGLLLKNNDPKDTSNCVCLGNINIYSNISDKSNFTFEVIPSADKKENFTGNPFENIKDTSLSEFQVHTVSHSGKEYSLDEFVPISNADGSYTFKSVSTAEDKAALEKIVSQLTFADISKLSKDFPAIKKLDQYLIKEVDAMSFNEFIKRYNTDNNFKQYPVVTNKIGILSNQISLQEVSSLCDALSDKDFVTHYEKFQEKLKGQLVMQKFEARIEKLASNKNFMSSFSEVTKKSISAHLSQIKNTNAQVTYALRIEKLCNNKTLTSSEKNDILKLGRMLFDNKQGLISKLQNNGFDCSKFFETHAKLLDDQYQTKYQQILQQSSQQQIDSLIKLSSDIANDKKLFIHFDAIISRDRNRFYRQVQELESRLREQANKIVEQNKTINNILSPELSSMLKKLDIKFQDAPKYSEVSLQWENQQQINKLLNQSADVFKTLEATVADTDFKESLKILPLAQQINATNPEIASELLEGFKTYLTQYGIGVKNEIVDQLKGEVTNTAIGAGITAGKMALSYLAPQFSIPYYVGKALYATYKANGIYTTSKQILSDLTQLYAAVSDGNPTGIGKFSVRCVSDLAAILFSHKAKATVNNKLPEFSAAIKQGVKDARNLEKLKVENIGKFRDFYKKMQKYCKKTNYSYSKKTIYQIEQKNNNPYLPEGALFYIDGLHYDHIEVFSNRGRVIAVLNLDGTLNQNKTLAALNDNRILKLK